MPRRWFHSKLCLLSSVLGHWKYLHHLAPWFFAPHPGCEMHMHENRWVVGPHENLRKPESFCGILYVLSGFWNMSTNCSITFDYGRPHPSTPWNLAQHPKRSRRCQWPVPPGLGWDLMGGYTTHKAEEVETVHKCILLATKSWSKNLSWVLCPFDSNSQKYKPCRWSMVVITGGFPHSESTYINIIHAPIMIHYIDLYRFI